jgi:TonB family protein
LYKPRPEYTAEGRNLKLEGDVVLDVVFLSDGRVQVNRVVSGLGHGLDESAVHAAELIKFKPALRDGQPVNYPARVRIEFRLAY